MLYFIKFHPERAKLITTTLKMLRKWNITPSNSFDAEPLKIGSFSSLKKRMVIHQKAFVRAQTFFKIVCKHIFGVAIRSKKAKVPAEAKDVPIGLKRKRGRPKTARKALLVD